MKNILPFFRVSVPALLWLVFLQGCHQTKKSDEQGRFRPEYHFTPESHWMNDPNGMVHYKGVYHLFYQYYPDSTVWGPMHWGHATTTDLVHWKHLPVALAPDSLGYIFSGSAVVDKNNTSGLGTGDNPPLVAIFTYHNPDAGAYKESQGLAFSLDSGRTWTKYEHNPVLKNPGLKNFRDPNFFWNEDRGKWIMILTGGDHVRLYESANLLSWELVSEFGQDAGSHDGVWECPDLFPLTMKNSDTRKWVMLVSVNPGGPNGGSATQYFTGAFDGRNFIPDSRETKWVDYGPDDYAGVTWSNTGDRKIFLGWMSNWAYANKVPTGPWRGIMTLPRELSLVNNNGEYILKSFPVKEFRDILDTLRAIKNKTIDSGNLDIVIPDEESTSFALELDPDLSQCDSFHIRLSNQLDEKLVISLAPSSKTMIINRSSSGITDFSPAFNGISTAGIPFLPGQKTNIFLVTDRCSVEVFINKGESVMTVLCFPHSPYDKISLYTSGGKAACGEIRLSKPVAGEEQK